MQGSCEYCGLNFSGSGYSPDGKHRFCCYGCYLVQKIIGTQGEEGIASWIIIRLGIGAFLSMNVMMISLVLYAQPASELGISTVRNLHWALLILSTPAIIILATPFISGSIRGLRFGKLSTDALITTGSIAAYGVSTYHVISGYGHIYFDTATMLLLIVTLGRLLEASAKNRTAQSIREMIKITPDTARIRRDNQDIKIPSAEVQVGDLLIVKPGERIPADGCIISGRCLIEESAFTGEARPRDCSAGDNIYRGSVNCDGFITVEATAVGSASLIEQVASIIHEAQRNQAPIERLAERVASIFTPIVWLVAIGAALYWGIVRDNLPQAGMSALAILVVACPCALGLATSMATCIALGKAAQVGVLIRSGEILERLASVRRLFFDKTGTLTTGRLSVAHIQLLSDEISSNDVLAWAATLEIGSEHAIARAIINAAQIQGIQTGVINNLQVIPGLGVEGNATLNDATKQIAVGSFKFLSKSHVVPNRINHNSDFDELTATYIGIDKQIAAIIYLSDEIRSDAHHVIRLLADSGVDSAIISGDREAPTHRLADKVGVQDAWPGCSPIDKANIIKKANESKPASTAMVGDGINDAPGLAEAYVGIATGSGTDLARESSDVTLLGDDLSRIPWILELSKSTHRVIKQNLWWAFGYNSIAITLAFFGFVHPLIAAVSMFVSSFSVIANSMRLVRLENKQDSTEL